MCKALTNTTANVPLEKMYNIIVLRRQCTNVETITFRCYQQERIVETELLNLNNVGGQDFVILATAPAKQPISFDFKR